MMQKHKPFLFAVLTLLLVLGGTGEAGYRKDKLKSQEQKVIDYLRKDWNEDYTVTSVDIAMQAVGVKQSDETRFRIGSYIKAHPELHEVIRRWGWVTLVLTPDEKLIARALVNAQREGKPAPTVAEIAKAVEINESQAKRGLAMLGRYEIIERDGSPDSGGYKVLPKYLKWEPRLDFLFHKVTVAGGRQFNTN